MLICNGLVCWLSERFAYILLTDVKWWGRLRREAGKEIQAFVRRGHVGPVQVEKLLFYVKHPIKEIRGVGDFVERVAGKPDELWKKHGDETCLKSRREYMRFIGNNDKVTFIRLKNLRELANPVSADVLLKKLGILRMPRGGKYLSRDLLKQII